VRAAGSPVGYLLGLCGLAVAYYTSGRLGLSLPYYDHNIALVWPPTGIAVAVLFRFGLRYWPGVFVAAVGVGSLSFPLWAAVGAAVGNTLAPVASVVVLRRMRFDPAFPTQADVVRFIGVALGGMTISAANGAAWICLSASFPWDKYPDIAGVWWLGDAAGVLVFGTPLLTWSRDGWRAIRRRGEAVWLLLAFAACLLVSSVCLGPLYDELTRKYPLVLFPAVLMLWVGVRFGAWAGSTCGVILAAVAVQAATMGEGPFHRPDVHAGLLMLWAYIGGLTGVTLLLTAVTAGREQVEKQLLASEELYRSLVEDNPAMICRLDADGLVTFVNETYCRAHRKHAVEVIGESFAQTHQAEDRNRLAFALAALQRGGPPVDVEVLAPGGRMRWHKWTIRTIGRADGSPGGFQAIGLDVTDSRRAEQERRTAQDQMYQAQKLESLGVMAGGIAHEFNNILTGVLGHAELAGEESPHGSPVRSHLSQVTDGARRAADLVRQLLAYAGKGTMAVRLLDLNAVVRDTATLAAVSIPKRCQVRFEPGSAALVQADEAQLRQVIMNLILNSAEAIGNQPGTVQIRIDSRVLDSTDTASSGFQSVVLTPGEYVRLRVSDTGCGMAGEVRAKVFDPFFTTKFAGRGLGLAAVQGIVRAHRGTVEVESVPGRGTEFTILLPAVVAPTADHGTGEHATETQRVLRRQIQRMN
jgi:PAS domain S-box-containing protein